MTASIEELVARGTADRRLRDVTRGGGWYLVGSRACGWFVDDWSDWDTVVLRPADDVREDALADVADDIFDVRRPSLDDGGPSLGWHQRLRATHAVDVDVLGPAACERRERENLAVWAFDLQHAVALSTPSPAAEQYREDVAARFAAARPHLADTAYRRFRRARNEAVATLPRGDLVAQAVTAAGCVAHAARFWLLSGGEPHPGEKWLLPALRRRAPAGPLPAMAAAVDLRLRAAERFDALWQLWAAVDGRAVEVGVSPQLLARSPFTAAGRARPPDRP